MNLFWTYWLSCYVLMGIYLGITNGRIVRHLAYKHEKKPLAIANFLFFCSPFILLGFVLKIIVTLIILIFDKKQ